MVGPTSPSSSIEGNPLSDDLILDAPISSNPSSSPGGTDTHASPSSKIPSPKAIPVDSAVLSPEEGKAGSGDAGVAVVSMVVTKAGTDASHKDGSDFSSENLFEGALTESKEGMSNILQSEAEIVEGFIMALGAREKDVGGESPSAEESTRFCVEILVPPEPLEIVVGASSPLDDDEVLIHLVFKRKLHTASQPTVQRSVGTSGGPTTRGIVKKSLDLILEESCQNNLKRRRVTRQTVLEEESSSSPVVDLECGTSSQPIDESSKTEKTARCGGGISKKEKKLAAIGKTAEGPGAPVVRSKRKHIVAKSSKGKRPVTAPVGDDVKALVANIRIQKEENARLKSANASLKNQLEELTHQMICDQRAANERIDKLLAKL
ncbi:hypothetical protein HAX54_036504 [Datura stramonium]|uniref:Uncharacterized protein n=1 Tax=Datura stramonium TaxID=4076 RepID=A0ABS8VK98_DATST|nr:hypothetical protein [Datura stramonium]